MTFLSFDVKSSDTMCSTLENVFRIYANRPCIGYEKEKNEFSYLTYDRVYSMASSVRDALWRHGMQPGSFIGICGVNSVNWLRIMLGTLMADCVPVPMSCHLIPEHVVHILKNQKSVVFVAERQVEMIHGYVLFEYHLYHSVVSLEHILSRTRVLKISHKDRPLVVRFSSTQQKKEKTLSGVGSLRLACTKSTSSQHARTCVTKAKLTS